MKGSIGTSTHMVKGKKRERQLKALTNKITKLEKQYKKTPSQQLRSHIFKLKCKRVDFKYK